MFASISLTASPIRIRCTDATFEREPLVRPWGFKGGYMTEIWQTAVLLESDSGAQGIGLGSQSVLWSDASVFSGYSEAGGNALMFALTDYALHLIRGASFGTPLDLLDQVFPEVLEHGRRITGNPALRPTFALNALVPIDHAAWLLYAQENGFRSFDELLPSEYRPALAYRHRKVASIPTIGYSLPVEEVARLADAGHFVLKLKLGQPGCQAEMLEKDKERLTAIHHVLGSRRTEHTRNGRLPYYLDANGRYESRETLLRFLEHAEKIGALEHIAFLEEPFPEEFEEPVHDIPVTLVADESAHTDRDARRRIEQGYGAIALKPVAKTLSMTLRIAKLAHEHGVACFCADLTVNPILVDWNKTIAARLAPVTGFSVGLLENNGHQNYRDWARMQSYHPHAGAPWMEARDGVFELPSDFYRESGGILEPSQHYATLFGRGA